MAGASSRIRLQTEDAVRAGVGAFADLGADEVVLCCWAPDPAQLEQLAAVAGDVA